jgi:hypothetical protein
VTHELAGALQQASRIRQRCALEKAYVYVRGENIYVAEGHISQAGNRAAVMHKLADFVAALSHHFKPAMRDGSQFTCMLFHPRIDGGIPLDSAVESQQVRFHRRFSAFEINGYVAPLLYQQAGIAPRSSWRFCETLFAVSQITQFHFPFCPVLKNGVWKRHEQKNSEELPTRQMVFGGPPDEKTSPNQNHNPIHEMDND